MILPCENNKVALEAERRIQNQVSPGRVFQLPEIQECVLTSILDKEISMIVEVQILIATLEKQPNYSPIDTF